MGGSIAIFEVSVLWLCRWDNRGTEFLAIILAIENSLLAMKYNVIAFKNETLVEFVEYEAGVVVVGRKSNSGVWIPHCGTAREIEIWIKQHGRKQIYLITTCVTRFGGNPITVDAPLILSDCVWITGGNQCGCKTPSRAPIKVFQRSETGVRWVWCFLVATSPSRQPNWSESATLHTGFSHYLLFILETRCTQSSKGDVMLNTRELLTTLIHPLERFMGSGDAPPGGLGGKPPNVLSPMGCIPSFLTTLQGAMTTSRSLNHIRFGHIYICIYNPFRRMDGNGFVVEFFPKISSENWMS